MFWANRSFAHFLWATWGTRSWSLICLEWPEQFAHGRSFLLSDLSNLLTVAHLSWAIWANRSQLLIWFEWNERMSNERMSEFPALYIRYRYRYRYRYMYMYMYMYIYIPNLLYIHCYIRGNLSNKKICVKMMILALVAARTFLYVTYWHNSKPQ